MGTNYYWHAPENPVCETCGHQPESEVLHIGKSSAGWCFGLHVILERGLNSWEEWVLFLKAADGEIRDEYERVVAFDDLRSVVTERRAGPYGPPKRHSGHACIGHGSGTWDLIAGEFG